MLREVNSTYTSYRYPTPCENSVFDEQLTKLLAAFKIFAKSDSKCQQWLNELEENIENDKVELLIEQRNNHYIDCVWSNPDCTTGPDTCKCHYRKWSPLSYLRTIIEEMGLKYILWSLEQK